MEINQVLTTIGKSIDLDLIEEHSETFKIFIAETAGTDERYARLHSLRGVIENKRGEGALALLGLMEHEPHPSLVRNLSFFASELIEVAGEQPLGGPRLVIDFIMSRNPYSGWKGSAIAGMVQLGDKRVNQMLLEAWSALEDEDKRIASEPEGSKGLCTSRESSTSTSHLSSKVAMTLFSDRLLELYVEFQVRRKKSSYSMSKELFQRILPTARQFGTKIPIPNLSF